MHDNALAVVSFVQTVYGWAALGEPPPPARANSSSESSHRQSRVVDHCK